MVAIGKLHEGRGGDTRNSKAQHKPPSIPREPTMEGQGHANTHTPSDASVVLHQDVRDAIAIHIAQDRLTHQARTIDLPHTHHADTHVSGASTMTWVCA